MNPFEESKKYFPTPIQMFQFFDKYSRFDWSKGRRETWVETVDRAVGFLRELSGNKLDDGDYNEIRDAMLNMEVMPSMRLVAMAGEAARRNNMAIFNCSFIPVDSIDSFVEALLVSMAGTGVGFSVESQFVNELPVVSKQKGANPHLHVVGDSAEGWGEALRVGLEAWFSGGDVVFDYSNVRPAGAILRTKGGRASGPEPLRRLLDFARQKILERQGDRLRPIDAHDIMCMIGGCVISGGTRRSAMLSLFDFDDHDMMVAKHPENMVGNEQRWNANNSAVWPDRRLSYEEVDSFLSVVFESGTGEPGIFSRRAARLTMPHKRDKNHVFGVNPSMTGDTLVLTSGGIVPISTLANKEFTVFGLDGQPALATCFKSADNAKLYGVTLENGYTYRVTKEHKWPVVVDGGEVVRKRTDELEPGDKMVVVRRDSLPIRGDGSESFSDGVVSGILFGFTNSSGGWWGSSDGKIRVSAIEYSRFGNMMSAMLGRQWSYGEYEDDFWFEMDVSDVMSYAGGPDGSVPDLVWSSGNEMYRKGFLDGVITSIGYPHLSGSDKKHSKIVFLLNEGASLQLRELLGFYGVISWVDNSGHLVIDDKDSVSHLNSLLVVSHSPKHDKIEGMADSVETSKRGFISVSSVEPLHEREDVWDITVMDDDHSFQVSQCVTGNCGEIVLRPYQTCNLSIAVARPDDTEDSLRRKVRLATIIGTIQSMGDHYPGLNPKWRENADEERLLGVDITGQLDSAVAQDPDVQRRLRDVAISVNAEYADKLGINRSASVTCVKPSGNSSVLLGCSPGIHPRWSKYYIRNVRVNANSPLFHVLRDAGVPMDPENGQTRDNATTWVVHFPIEAPDGAVLRNDRGALEQLDYWLQVKKNWTTHNPSATIHYRDDETEGIKQWVYEHQDWIGGITFLPSVDAMYDQMPYEEITKEEYERLASEFPDIDFSRIADYEKEDTTTAAQELACMAGSCEVDYGADVSQLSFGLN